MVKEEEDGAKILKGMGWLALTETLKSTFSALNCQYGEYMKRGAVRSDSVAGFLEVQNRTRIREKSWEGSGWHEAFSEVLRWGWVGGISKERWAGEKAA